MKVYKANVTVTAVFYDGSNLAEIVEFTTTARGVERVVEMSSNRGLFIKVTVSYKSVWLPIPTNVYIVKYPNGLIYPVRKSTFEKRFKEVKTIEKQRRTA